MRSIPCAFLLLGVAACGADVAESKPVGASQVASELGRVTVETVASGLEHPWGLAFLPDGRMLVSERPGRLRLVSTEGQLSSPLAGLPEVAAIGQGGLLDVAIDPAFGSNQRVYLSFAEPGEGGAGTAVLRARLGDTSLENVAVIFRQQPKVQGGHHFGSRLVFDRDGLLFITTGDRQVQPNAQALDRGQGKIYRIRTDGSVPSDAPFSAQPRAVRGLWSYGHRNPQGAALHPQTGELWSVEHGARGGDELNIVRAGRNYGWPVISLGVNYNGQPIGSGESHRYGMEQPIHQWTPSIAPSGMAFYTSDRFPAWRGNLFVGALAHRHLARLQLDGKRVEHEEKLLLELGERIRDVRQGPDGALYLLTDSPQGRILRVTLQPR